MKKKIFLFSLVVSILAIILSSTSLCYLTYTFSIEDDTNEEVEEETSTKAIMLLIEFEEETTGLENFVYEMSQRNIPGLLMVSTDFAEEHTEVLKEILNYDIEIAASYSSEPLWDVSYEEQVSIMTDTIGRVEKAVGIDVRVFGSRYFAYDENTLKVAEELGIEYIMARGTTGAQATIYQPEEYEVKIFSVSNVTSESWGTGSLCDYSYWAREGSPDEFSEEMYSAYNTYDKISPVSHTYIGGLKKRWFDIYMEFFDNTDIDWLDLDTFGEVDISSSITDIPENREVQYTTPNPETPLDEEEDIYNPCSVVSIDNIENDSTENSSNESEEEGSLIIFHNGVGSMCLEALDFFEENEIEYTEYLTDDEGFYDLLVEYKDDFNGISEGVSTSFGYYPLIFVGEKAFSGFNDEVEEEVLEILEI